MAIVWGSGPESVRQTVGTPVSQARSSKMDPQPRMGPLRDPDLDHQVVIELQSNRLVVSCNCRLVRGQFGLHYEPIGRTCGPSETKALYNNPEAHWIPFSDNDALSFAPREE